MYQPRQILAYGILSFFLVFVLFYGFADSLAKMYPMGARSTWGSLNSLKTQTDSDLSAPDFSRYDRLKILTSKDFPLDDPTRRIIIVGDIHGMMKSFEKLLKRVKYSPESDVLVHVGDILAKGPHTGSLSVLRYMASNDITGVRGNHDQEIIEWRGWLDRVSSIHGVRSWLDNLENRWNTAHSNGSSSTLESWLKAERKYSPRSEKAWWKLIPSDWTIFSDHYKIAKDMSKKDFRYLLKLPLRLYVPSAHTFIVHAGLLSSDPRYPGDDKSRQPLANVPPLPQPPTATITTSRDESSTKGDHIKPTSSSKTIEELRNLQEIGILTQIPQNLDPWVVLNMRNIVKGEVSRKTDKGTPWAETWEEHMEKCVGFNHERRQSIEKEDGEDDEQPDLKVARKLHLSCYPSTTVFGHTASRGLDVKRWSFGLDSGCVYERRLSALVIQGFTKASNKDYTPNKDVQNEGNPNGELQDVDDDDDDGSTNASVKHRLLPFGDRNSATAVSVKCRR
ncbi:hypothetical protein GALMADRAFT_247567 [Galerina marginata CBS 339.88]|uniref:Calcineurin-like phosphoesterase domain-containing protein n=1 Tax=Galerina marginata (strain CBS 339.88) TaxID=685588 RepID=A0A067TB83_GALM3|nr:hypothetical protein GALMADRAFT_247567 [Galerina marginata CBS 339.88]